jgi:hypothetical protein
MKRQIIRVEPLATWLDNYKAPTFDVPAWNGGFDIEMDCIAAV